MLVNSATLQALRVGFKTEFQNAFDAVPQMKDKVSKTVKSSTALNTYGWLKGLTGLREWLGPRQIDNLSEASYTLLNKHFEKTIAVNRNNIEDDNLGMYSDGFSMMGDGAARLRRGQPLLLRGRDAPFEGAAYASCGGVPVAFGTVERGELVPSRVFNLPI